MRGMDTIWLIEWGDVSGLSAPICFWKHFYSDESSFDFMTIDSLEKWTNYWVMLKTYLKVFGFFKNAYWIVR